MHRVLFSFPPLSYSHEASSSLLPLLLHRSHLPWPDDDNTKEWIDLLTCLRLLASPPLPPCLATFLLLHALLDVSAMVPSQPPGLLLLDRRGKVSILMLEERRREEEKEKKPPSFLLVLCGLENAFFPRPSEEKSGRKRRKIEALFTCDAAKGQ